MRPSEKREDWERMKIKLTTENVYCLSETATAYGTSEETGIHALAAVVNSLAAAGGIGPAVSVSIEYPTGMDKFIIYRMEKSIKRVCQEKGIRLSESAFSVNPLPGVPAVSVNGMAFSEKKDSVSGGKAGLPGKEIVLSKWIGMDGMLRIAAERKEELEKHFAPAFMRDVHSYRQHLFSETEIKIAWDMKVPVLKQISQGGIFAALWKLSAELGCGLDLELKKMLILQETVEICEYFRINPYQLTSAGCFLFMTDDAGKLVGRMEESGIEASVIGRLTEGRDKVIRNGEDIRYIDRPAPDEIFKIYAGADQRRAGC